MSLLSENLQYWRAERPSEWKMDEFINDIVLNRTSVPGIQEAINALSVVETIYNK